nr:MAG TPA: hypothetical protein [Caudoviricetes sp.]
MADKPCPVSVKHVIHWHCLLSVSPIRLGRTHHNHFKTRAFTGYSITLEIMRKACKQIALLF